MILPKISFNIEKWKFNSEYQVYVSNMGNFKDKDKRNLPKKIWKGYHAVYTCVGYRPCHRLVARTWIPTPDMENLTVDHKDSNRRNNAVSNLEWVSEDENINRARSNELKKSDVAASTLRHYESVKNLTKSDIIEPTITIGSTFHYNEKITKYNDLNDNCGYTYTKNNINFTFNDISEAVHFIVVILGSQEKPKNIARMISEASAKGCKYHNGKWERIKKGV